MVPPWARKEDGCLLTSLPSLTVVFLPEQGAVELASDCGLDGTRRIACKGQANREEMMRQLSCDHEATSPADSSTSPELTSTTNEGSPGARSWTSSQSQGTSDDVTGTRGWTSHSFEPPTRHRRDTDLVTSAATTAVTDDREAKPTTAEEHFSVATPPKDLEVDTSSLPTQKTAGSQQTQLTTVDDGTATPTTLNESSPSEDTFIAVKELDIIAENVTDKAATKTTTLATPTTTVVPSTPANASRVEAVTPPSESTASNVTETSHVATALVTEATATVVKVNATESAEPREDVPVNYTVNVDTRKSDEIKSREEAEEELLKEAERKEAERKFKEEEDTRRRQFLPPALRGVPRPKFVPNPTPVPIVVEEYEEPEEAMEPEPEAPARPNRGRRLTRPQPHSFYPYFLNRVLG